MTPKPHTKRSASPRGSLQVGTPDKAANLSDSAYASIKNAILTGTFKPGSWLQEEQIAQQLAISRTPVREAIKRLHGEGLLIPVYRKGWKTVDLTSDQLDSLYEVREKIELAFFESAARRLAASDYAVYRDKFLAIQNELEKVASNAERCDKTRIAFMELDRAFHDHLIFASGNEYWIKLYMQIRDLIIISIVRHSLSADNVASALADHLAILDELIEGDVDRARQRMLDHIQNTRQAIGESWKNERIRVLASGMMSTTALG